MSQTTDIHVFSNPAAGRRHAFACMQAGRQAGSLICRVRMCKRKDGRMDGWESALRGDNM